ncbi:MAG: hypothetical protein ABJC61_09460 [Acidobacteriota bacterium]
MIDATPTAPVATAETIPTRVECFDRGQLKLAALAVRMEIEQANTRDTAT